MDLHRMRFLSRLRYFVAVAEELHFGRAAERLQMAQPALTRQIRLLEEEFATPLFVRNAKGAELSEAGQTLLRESCRILEAAEQAGEAMKRLRSGLTGDLDIGVSSAALFVAVPHFVSAFKLARPGVNIRLHNMTKVQQLEALDKRRISIGFNRLSSVETGVSVRVLVREKVLVALHEGHRLAAQPEVSVRALDDEPMILYPRLPPAGPADQLSDAFALDGARLRVVQEVENVFTATALVSGGFGLSITVGSTARMLQLPGVVYRPLVSRHIQDMSLSCMFRSDDRSPALMAFLEVIGQRAELLGSDPPG